MIKTLDPAVEMILAAKRPMIMVGGAASRLNQHSIAQIRDFVQRTGIPFFATRRQMASTLSPDRLHALRSRFRGDLIHPESDAYESARKVWNG